MLASLPRQVRREVIRHPPCTQNQYEEVIIALRHHWIDAIMRMVSIVAASLIRDLAIVTETMGHGQRKGHSERMITVAIDKRV